MKIIIEDQRRIEGPETMPLGELEVGQGFRWAKNDPYVGHVRGEVQPGCIPIYLVDGKISCISHPDRLVYPAKGDRWPAPEPEYRPYEWDEVEVGQWLMDEGGDLRVKLTETDYLKLMETIYLKFVWRRVFLLPAGTHWPHYRPMTPVSVQLEVTPVEGEVPMVGACKLEPGERFKRGGTTYLITPKVDGLDEWAGVTEDWTKAIHVEPNTLVQAIDRATTPDPVDLSVRGAMAWASSNNHRLCIGLGGGQYVIVKMDGGSPVDPGHGFSAKDLLVRHRQPIDTLRVTING